MPLLLLLPFLRHARGCPSPRLWGAVVSITLSHFVSQAILCTVSGSVLGSNLGSSKVMAQSVSASSSQIEEETVSRYSHYLASVSRHELNWAIIHILNTLSYHPQSHSSEGRINQIPLYHRGKIAALLSELQRRRHNFQLSQCPSSKPYSTPHHGRESQAQTAPLNTVDSSHHSQDFLQAHHITSRLASSSPQRPDTTQPLVTPADHPPQPSICLCGEESFAPQHKTISLLTNTFPTTPCTPLLASLDELSALNHRQFMIQAINSMNTLAVSSSSPEDIIDDYAGFIIALAEQIRTRKLNLIDEIEKRTLEINFISSNGSFDFSHIDHALPLLAVMAYLGIKPYSEREEPIYNSQK